MSPGNSLLLLFDWEDWMIPWVTGMVICLAVMFALAKCDDAGLRVSPLLIAPLVVIAGVVTAGLIIWIALLGHDGAAVILAIQAGVTFRLWYVYLFIEPGYGR